MCIFNQLTELLNEIFSYYILFYLVGASAEMPSVRWSRDDLIFWLESIIWFESTTSKNVGIFNIPKIAHWLCSESLSVWLCPGKTTACMLMRSFYISNRISCDVCCLVCSVCCADCTSYYIPAQFLRRPTYFQSPPWPPLPDEQRWKSSRFTAIKQNAQEFVFHFRLSLSHGCVPSALWSSSEWEWSHSLRCAFLAPTHTQSSSLAGMGAVCEYAIASIVNTSIWAESLTYTTLFARTLASIFDTPRQSKSQCGWWSVRSFALLFMPAFAVVASCIPAPNV